MQVETLCQGHNGVVSEVCLLAIPIHSNQLGILKMTSAKLKLSLFRAAVVSFISIQCGSALARDMSTDRPDKTESAYTLDADRWQIELDAVNFTRDKEAGTRVDTIAIAPFNLKYGIGSSTDVQFVLAPYTFAESSGSGTSSSASGFGDLIIRVKQNLFGNDEGDVALAVMPFVKFPTASNDLGGNDDVEGGVILPLAIGLSPSVGLGLMAQLNVLKDSSSDYSTEWVASATAGIDLTEELGIYIELFASEFDDVGEETVATFDMGFTYALNEDLQLDTGVNIGMTSAADDLQTFLGVSKRW